MKIFEVLGKATLHKYFFPLFALSLFISSLFFFIFFLLQEQKLKDLSIRFSSLCEKRAVTSQKRAYKKNFLSRYQSFDPFFLEKNLESLPLLQKESQKIESLLHHPGFFSQEELRSRLQFLQGTQNRIKFKEENFRHCSLFDEVELSMMQPVEIDWEDLAKILSCTEGVKIQHHSSPPGRPQLIIRKMDLEKRKENSETLLLHLELVKREYLKRSAS